MSPAASRSPVAIAGELPPLPERPVVSVIVPARDAAAGLEGAVTTALSQEPTPDEVVIAVGPSRDDTRGRAQALAAAHPDRVLVVDNPSGATADGLNAAIARARGQVLARVDAHAVLPPGYLATAVATLRRTGAGNVGGVQHPVGNTPMGRAVAAAMRSPAGTGGARYRSGGAEGPVDTVYLGVFRREALAAVGGFDPAFVRNQDAELNLRLTAAGYPVWFDPRLQVTYRPRQDLGSLARQYLGYGRWRRLTVRTHPGSLRARQLAAPLVVLALAGAGLASILSRDARPGTLVAGGYLGAVGLAGAHAAERPREAPATALALLTMHVSWGVGFLLGPPRHVRSAL